MYWTGQRIRETIAAYQARRAQKAAIEAEAKAKLAADAARRLREAAEEKERGMVEVYAREAERRRVAELSARGGVPIQDADEFAVVPDVEATYQAQRRGDPDFVRYRQAHGTRRDLKGSQLPRIDMEATAVARLTNPSAPPVYYWPETP